MARSKGSVKRKVKKRKVKRALPAAYEYVDRALLPPSFSGLCNLPRVCAYLDKLYKWTVLLNADYKKLRVAVCNVEKEAFSGTGQNAKPPKFCTGGGGTEPADPPKPPDW